MKPEFTSQRGLPKGLSFQALVYREDELWLAHCLELDVVAQAHSADEAIRGMMNAVDALLADALAEHGTVEHLLKERRAPEEFWNRLRAAKWRQHVRHKAPFSLISPKVGVDRAEPPTMEVEAGLELCAN